MRRMISFGLLAASTFTAGYIVSTVFSRARVLAQSGRVAFTATVVSKSYDPDQIERASELIKPVLDLPGRREVGIDPFTQSLSTVSNSKREDSPVSEPAGPILCGPGYQRKADHRRPKSTAIRYPGLSSHPPVLDAQDLRRRRSA